MRLQYRWTLAVKHLCLTKRLCGLQITGFDVVSTWLYPQQPLSIIKVDANSYPDLFSALQVELCLDLREPCTSAEAHNWHACMHACAVFAMTAESMVSCCHPANASDCTAQSEIRGTAADWVLSVQGAGQTHGAVIAFYANLQRLPENGLIRVTQAIWPLAEAPDAWATWQAYNVRLVSILC